MFKILIIKGKRSTLMKHSKIISVKRLNEINKCIHYSIKRKAGAGFIVEKNQFEASATRRENLNIQKYKHD